MEHRGHSRGEVWRSGYYFALFTLFLLGITLIAYGASAHPQGSFWNVLFVGAGIAMAPAALIGALFRFFLFKEVQHQLTEPVVDSIQERFREEVHEQVTQILGDYRAEVENLAALHEAGIIRPYRRRRDALQDFIPDLQAEETEIMVVGSSLKGLLIHEDYEKFSSILREKIKSPTVRVKFLLTHPVLADLRAFQEARAFKEIGEEILAALRLLQSWNQPIEQVRLYRGTPTCFAIKTRTKMVLNPYPYASVAFDSPCLLIEAGTDGARYFYSVFDRAHFGAWETAVALRLSDYDATIDELQTKLEDYANQIGEISES